MKRQVLFVQGGGEGVHDGWDHKLVASLRTALGDDYEVLYPRMPREEEPSYERWKPALDEALAGLEEGAFVVAHSVGGTVLVRLLAERAAARALGGVLLIAAPFVGEGGWKVEGMRLPKDLGARLPEGVPVHLFHGLDDATAPPAHCDLYAEAIPEARVHRLPGRDHQLNDDLREVALAITSEVGAKTR